MTPRVVLYTQSGCRFCAAARALLARHAIEHEEVDLTDDADARAALIARTGLRTLPQLLVAEVLIGGFDELLALNRAGRLEARVAEALRAHGTGAPA